MGYTDFLVDREQHMRPLEYDLSDNFNELVRYLHDMGVLDNVPVATLGPADVLSASDALAAPLRSLAVGGNSTQDGTPTPDAPVAIESAVDPVLTFAGKNLMTQSSVDQWTLANGWLNVGQNKRKGFYVGPNARYTVSVTITKSFPSDTQTRLYVTGTSEFIDVGGKTGRYSIVGTATADGIGAVAINSHVVSDPERGPYLTDVQLELGSTATAYEPYQAATVTLPVTLRGLPDGTRDELALTYLRPSTRAGWAWYSGKVTRAVGHVADMGELAWNASGAANGIYYAAIDTNNSVGACLCSCYQWQNSTTSGNLQDGHACKQSAYARVLVKDTAHAGLTSAEYAALVSGQTFDYMLATPTTETLPEIELPVLPAPNVTIYATADATPQLTAEYVRDLSSTINDMQEAIADI